MSEEEKEREEYVRQYGQSVVNDVRDLLGLVHTLCGYHI